MSAEFINQLYRQFFGRQPDLNGFVYWTQALDSGSQNAADITDAFLKSDENKNFYKPILQLYLTAFNRMPDAGGLAYWVNDFRNGATLQDIAAGMAASEEFKNLYAQQSDEQFIKDLYFNGLSRAPDVLGEQYWNAVLLTGGSRASVMLSFAISSEMTEMRSEEIEYILLHHGIFGEMPTREMVDAALPVANWEALIESLYESSDYSGVDVPGLDRYEPPEPEPEPEPDPKLEPDFGPPPDTISPTLSSSNPADDAINVDASADIILTFSETVVAGSGNIVISNGSDTRTIAVTDLQVTIAGNVVTINPTSELLIGSTYNIQIAAGAFLDGAGNAYAGISSATQLDFTIDSTAPTIVAFTVSSPTTLSVTSSEEGTAGLYNGSTLVGSTSTLSAANTAYGISVAAQSTKTTASLQVADRSGNVTISATPVLLGTSGNNPDLIGDPTIPTTEYIFGFDGNDWLEGKQEGDVLSGGTGQDVFYTFTIVGYTSDSTYASFDTITDLTSEDTLRIVLYEAHVFDANSSAYLTSMTTPRNFVVVKQHGRDIDCSDTIVVDVGSYSPLTAITNGIVTFHLHGVSTGTTNDSLSGGAGSDVIYGYGGADVFAGGTGADIFAYASVADSAASVSPDTTVTFDAISDFTSGTDTISLVLINAALTGGAAATGTTISTLTTSVSSMNDTTIANYAELVTAVGSLVASAAGTAGTGTGLQAYVIDLTGNTGALGTGKYLLVNDADTSMDAGDLFILLSGTSTSPVAGDFTLV